MCVSSSTTTHRIVAVQSANSGVSYIAFPLRVLNSIDTLAYLRTQANGT
jgi:hypothetical protein